MVAAPAASAQTPATFEDLLVRASTDENLDHLYDLILGRRLDVKPALGVITARFIDARLSGKSKEAERLLDAASLIGKEFEHIFGERSLSVRARYLHDWSHAQLDIKRRADSLLTAGIAIRSGDTREDAYKLYLEAESLFGEIGDEAGLAEVLGQKGYVNWWLDRDRYLEFNTRALDIRRRIDDRQLIGNSLNDVGLYNRVIARDYESALAAYLEGERIRWDIGDSLAQSRMLPNIGLSYEGLGDYSRAQEYYLKASDLYLAVGDTARSITQRNNAAGILTDYLGRHSEAMSIFLGLRQELEDIDDPRTWALVLNSLGIVNRRLGDYEAAILNYREVVRISEKHGYEDLLSHALNNIGVVHLWVSRPERAIPYLERALEQYRAGGVRSGVVNALQNLGTASFDLAAYDSSEIFLSEALIESDSLADPVGRAGILTALANTRLRGDGPEAAIPVYREALEMAETLEVPDLEMSILFWLGESAERSGDASTALAYYDRGIRSIEDARGLLRLEEDKAGFIAQSRYLYEDVIHFLTREALSTGDDTWAKAAFNFAERSKARGFLDQLAEAMGGVSSGVDPELLSDQRILTENLAYLRSELEQADPRTEADRIADIKQMMREQEAEFDRLEREIRDRNPRYADLQYPDPIDVGEVQSQLLGSGDLLLQYAVGDSSSTLWAVGSGSISTYALPARKELEARIDLLRFALTNPDRMSVQSFAVPARTLFEVLLAPAAAEIAESTNLIIVPDDILHYLPFEVLLESEPGEDENFAELPYLVRRIGIRYGQSASVLRQLRLQAEDHSETSHDFLAVGDPVFTGKGGGNFMRSNLESLPFSGAEVTSISRLFDPERSSVFTQEGATESAVRAALDSDAFRFVHFATHGLINDDRPDYSALAFSRNDDEHDGLLQALEEWCHAAEASGIEALREFSGRLKRYELAPA